jgi:methyl-accepting chemotaxis protein
LSFAPAKGGPSAASLRARFDRLPVAGKLVALCAGAISLLLAIGFTVVTLQASAVVGRGSSDTAEATAERYASGIATDVNGIVGASHAMARSISTDLTANSFSAERTMGQLRGFLDAAPTVLGAWSILEPDYNRPDLAGNTMYNVAGGFAPYLTRDKSGAVTAQDASPPEDWQKDYYAEGLKRAAGRLSIPYSYPVDGKDVLMFSITFPLRRGEQVVGVSGFDISLDDLSADLMKQKPLGSGRVRLIAQDGKWIAHENPAMRMKPYDEDQKELIDAVIKAGTPQRFAHVAADGTSWARFVVPVAVDGIADRWAVVVDIPQAAITAPASALTWLLVVIAIVLVAGALGTLWFASKRVVGLPLGRLSDTVDRLAAGEDLPVGETDRADEIGTLARAADVFRLAAAEREREQARNAAEQAAVTAAIGTGLAALREGRLATRIDAAFPPAYEQLKADFNATAATLRDLIAAVVERSQRIDTGSSEIARAAEDLASRSESSAASLEQTSAALAQITDRLRTSAASADETLHCAQRANASVTGGRDVASGAVEAMHRVSECARGIDDVIEGLDKIAFQTRVLAMNAAVEAGRAGEAGRGFAVVADLVSALAARAEEEAKRARDQLTVTQTEVASAVGAVGQVDNALVGISDIFTQVDRLVAAMVEDNKVQATSISEIAVAVNGMDRTTQQNAAMVEQTSAAAQQLRTEATDLAGRARAFDIGGGSARRPDYAAAA